MPVTLNYTKGGASGIPYGGHNRFGVIENTIDFAAKPAGAGDTVQALNIPAGTRVLFAGHKVIKAEGGTAAGTFGDGVDPDGFIAASDLNAAAGAIQVSGLALTEGTPNTITGYSNGKFYPASDTLDYVTTQALDTAVVRFFAVVVDLN